MTAPIAQASINVPAGANNAMAATGAADPLGLFGLLLAGLGMEQAAVSEADAAPDKNTQDSADSDAGAEDAEAAPSDAAQTLALLIAAGQAAPPPVQPTAPATTGEAEVSVVAPALPGQAGDVPSDALFAAAPDAPAQQTLGVGDHAGQAAASDPLKPFAANLKDNVPAPQAATAASTPAASKAEAAPVVAEAPAPVQSTAPAPASVQVAAAVTAAVAQAPRQTDAATTPAPKTGQTDRAAAATPKASRAAPLEADQGEAPVAHTKVEAAPRADEQISPFSRTAAKPAVELAAAPVEDKPSADVKADPAPVAQAAALASAANAAPAAALPVRGSPETVAKLAADIVRKLEGATTRFEVGLDPIGLGRVEVKVEIGPSGRMHASMTFDNAQAAADVGRRSGELRVALEQAGFDLSGGSLSFDVAGQGGQGRGHAFDQERSGGRPAQAAFEAALTMGDDADIIPAWRPGPVASGVDIRI